MPTKYIPWTRQIVVEGERVTELDEVEEDYKNYPRYAKRQNVEIAPILDRERKRGKWNSNSRR